MDSYVFLIRNKDLCFIGSTNSLENIQKLLSPGELIFYLKSDNSEVVCNNIHKMYSEVRLPKSDYFRLTKNQISDCKKLLEKMDSSNYFQPIFRGPILYFAYLIFWLLLSFLVIEFAINPILENLM